MGCAACKVNKISNKGETKKERESPNNSNPSVTIQKTENFNIIGLQIYNENNNIKNNNVNQSNSSFNQGKSNFFKLKISFLANRSFFSQTEFFNDFS